MWRVIRKPRRRNASTTTLVAWLIFALLSGCGERPDLILAAGTVQEAAEERVLVASTRAFEDGQFTDDRLERPGYFDMTVRIPPDRQMGDAEAARSGHIDPDTMYFLTEAQALPDERSLRERIVNAFGTVADGSGREVMIFVHGYNTSMADGVYRTAQIRHDFDIPAIALHFAWASSEHPLGYAYDRDSLLQSRDAFERLLIDIAAVPGVEIILLSHSLGGALTMEALRQLRIGGRQDVLDAIGGVVLMSPDIDIDVFRAQAHRLSPLPQPFVIFTATDDRALRLSARITGENRRVGNLGSPEALAGLDVTLVDVTMFDSAGDDPLNHFTAVSSPGLIRLFNRLGDLNLALGSGVVRLGALPGAVLSIRSATHVLLSP